MPNTFFRFKQFTVQQSQTAMKVCTDSCLFGAWAAAWLSQQQQVTNILDIGAGTGLLSLMLAQKNNAVCIDAIESDELSAQQAKQNFSLCEWTERLRVFEISLQTFYTNKPYDFIICNPPFYEHDLRSGNEAKNKAHHSAGLTLRELMNAIERLLSGEGNFAVLLPYHRTEEFALLAKESGFFINKKTTVKQTEQHPYFRSMLLFSKQRKTVEQDELFIKDNQNRYSAAFHFLLKDYYLHF